MLLTNAKETLMENGAVYNFQQQDENGMSIIFKAAAQGDTKLMELLINLQQSPWQKCPNFGRTIFHYAAMNNKKDLIEFIIKRFAKLDPLFINAEDFKGYTALAYAAEGDYWDVFKLLQTKLDANIAHISVVDGLTILHRACFAKNKSLLEKLLA